MSHIAITVENLGKLYRIGGQQARYKRFTETVVDTLAAPLRRLGNLGKPIPPSETLWALKDVSFEVKEGEVVGIIGRNGAGKSTLLKVLSRITEPTEGEVRIRGRVGSLLEVGTGFHPELTGRENIYLNGAILGMRREEINRKFDEIVAFAEIEKFLDTPVKRYSSGMYVRLAFAVAAHLEPEVLVVDEVLAVGDVAFQKKCLGKMGDVAKGGRTVLFVSHNMQAVRQLCQRAIWLVEGRLAAEGPSSEVVLNYLQDIPKSETLANVALLIAQLPPDSVFHLEAVNVIQEGRPSTDLISGSPIDIEIAYTVFQEAFGLHVYFELYDAEGSLLFESIHNGDAEEMPVVTPGTYVSRATIPADFLAPTTYEVRILAGIANVRACIPKPLSIPLTVQATGRVNRAYPGYRTPGKLAPWIPWNTTQLTKNHKGNG